MADEEYDMIFKVVLIGDSGVGKTNILSRYVRDDFSIETKSTVGVEFGSKVLKVNNTSIKIQIWDTAGQEQYKSITKAYYKGARGAFVVYDITRKETFSSVEKWVDELKNNGDEGVCIILLGNKCDLEDQRQVSTEEAMRKSELYKIALCETSAMQAVNIDKAFTIMVEEIMKQIGKKDEDNANIIGSNDKNGIILDPNSEKGKITDSKSKKKCCKV